MTYLALKTMIVQNNMKHINTIGLAAAAAAYEDAYYRCIL